MSQLVISASGSDKNPNPNQNPNPIPVQVITWQDSSIEDRALAEVLMNHSTPDILMTAFSIDTILSLHSQHSSIKNITCVSENIPQIAFLELKANIVKYIQDPVERVKFLEGRCLLTAFYFNQIKKNLASVEHWNQHYQDIVKGIHNMDPLLALFTELKSSDLKKVFTYPKMISVFGKSQVYNSLSFPFSLYFEQVWKMHQRNPNNYYFHLMTEQKYVPGYYPEYLTRPAPAINKLRYINNGLINYLEHTKRNFDFIQIGNLTDSLDDRRLIELLVLLQKKIRPKGRLLIRTMNVDRINLRTHVNSYFVILDIDRNLVDQSFFYQDVILASPRKD